MTFANRFALAALLVIPAIASAQSRTAFAVAAGPSYPTGKFHDTQATGTDFNVGLIRGSDGTPVGLRLDYAYDKLKGRTLNGVSGPERRISSGSANILFSFSGYSMKPYLMGGVGGYKMTSKPSTADSKIRFGFDFGAGITLPLAGKAVFVESRINSISQTKAKPIRFVPLVVGFLF